MVGNGWLDLRWHRLDRAICLGRCLYLERGSFKGFQFREVPMCPWFYSRAHMNEHTLLYNVMEVVLRLIVKVLFVQHNSKTFHLSTISLQFFLFKTHFLFKPPHLFWFMSFAKTNSNYKVIIGPCTLFHVLTFF